MEQPILAPNARKVDNLEIPSATCDSCVLRDSGIRRCLPPTALKNVPRTKVCIVVEGATENAFESGELLNQRTGILWLGLQAAHKKLFKGVPFPQFAIISAVLCKLPNGTAMTDIVQVKCRARLIQEVIATECTHILAVGAAAVTALTGTAKFSISNIQGRTFKVRLDGSDKTHVLIPCYQPNLLHVKPLEYPNFMDALRLAVRAAQGETVFKQPGSTKWRLLDTPQKAIDYLHELQSIENGYVACDIETSNLSFTDSEMLCLGMCHAEAQAVVIPQEMLAAHVDVVAPLLSLPNIRYIWHNGKFDLGFLNTRGYQARIDDDTVLLHYALDENSGTHGLEKLSGRLLGASDYKHQLKTNLEEPGDSYAKLPKDVLHQYQAQDVDYTRQIFYILKEQVQEDPSLWWLYTNILVPAQNFLYGVETHGFYTHLEALQEANKKLAVQIDEAIDEIQEEVAPIWDVKQYGRDMNVVKLPTFFNPASPKQVAWLLYKKLKCVPQIVGAKKRSESATLPDTSEKTLQSIEPKPRFVVLLLQLRRLKKLHSTYVVSLLDKRDTEGRIHSTYSLFGTTTGRLASKKPNLQNIPRDKTIKSLFGAPPGRLILECDYKSAELRALAMYSQDPFLIRVFQNNFDMHDETAAAMFGKDFTSEQRMQAKMINFGIMYGRGPKTIAESCKITIQEAQNSINKWLQRMPAAAAYLKSRRNAVRSGCVLTTPFGRKRRFPFVTKQMLNTYQNEACNFAIQSIASDFTLITGIRIQKQLREFDAYIVNLVHDSLVVELPADYDTAVHLFNWVPQQMSETPARWFKLPFAFAADASIGTHWGRLYETVDEAFGR